MIQDSSTRLPTLDHIPKLDVSPYLNCYTFCKRLVVLLLCCRII